MSKTVPCTHCFEILGVGSRMKIFTYLKTNGPSSVSDVVDFVGLSQPTISYHLHEMEKAGLLKSTKKGKKRIFSISEICPNSHHECFLNKVEFPQG